MSVERVRRAIDPADRADASATYRLEDQVGFRLRRAHQRATEIFNEVMAGHDITPMQFALLAKLYDLGEASQNHLGRQAAMDQATTFGVVGRLLKRELVSQKPSRADGRVTLLTLTPEGRYVVERMMAIGPEVSRRTLGPLEPDEAATLLALLARIG
jgi:DNA-binding MarR family transcriptional regulator